jgi:hypothetical protein
MKKTFGLLVILVLSTASAENLVFTFGDSGNAKLEISQEFDLDADYANIMASADESGVMSFSGKLVDSLGSLDPDYNLRFLLSADEVEIIFGITGEGIREILEIGGEFDIKVVLLGQNNELNLNIEGMLSKRVLEEILLVDTSSVELGAQMIKREIEDTFNEIFSSSLFISRPSVIINGIELKESAGGYSLTLDMTITGWGELMSYLTYLDDSEEGMPLSCLGISEHEILGSIIGVESESHIEVIASDNSIGGKVKSSLRSSSAPSRVTLQYLNIELSKIGDETTLQGSATFNDMSSAMSCLMKIALPGEYIVSSIDYTITKPFGGQAIQSLEATLEGIAKKSGEKWRVEIPAEVTSDMDITVKAPSGMSILSVSGGRKTGERAAVSNQGEDFTVTYGEAEEDYTMWILIAVGVLLLIFLAKRKKA